MANKHLYVLWTSDNVITAEKMVFMYTINALKNKWWDEVTIIIWGASAKLVEENVAIQAKVKDAVDAGINMKACRACADQIGATEVLESLQVEVKYFGAPLSNILQSGEHIITI